MEYKIDPLNTLLNILALGVLLYFWPTVTEFSAGINIHPLLANFVLATVVIGLVHLASYIIVVVLRHYNLAQ